MPPHGAVNQPLTPYQ